MNYRRTRSNLQVACPAVVQGLKKDTNIARAAQNNALVYCLSSVIGSYHEAQKELDRIDSVPEEDIADHERILAAIKARHADRAGRAMKLHLRKTIARLEKPTA